MLFFISSSVRISLVGNEGNFDNSLISHGLMNVMLTATSSSKTSGRDSEGQSLSAALFVRMFLTAQSDTHLEETALAVPLGGQTDVTCRHVASVVVSVC